MNPAVTKKLAEAQRQLFRAAQCTEKGESDVRVLECLQETLDAMKLLNREVWALGHHERKGRL